MAWNGLPVNTYISMYARTNRCYNERGVRTSYVRFSIPHYILVPFSKSIHNYLKGQIMQALVFRYCNCLDWCLWGVNIPAVTSLIAGTSEDYVSPFFQGGKFKFNPKSFRLFRWLLLLCCWRWTLNGQRKWDVTNTAMLLPAGLCVSLPLTAPTDAWRQNAAGWGAYTPPLVFGIVRRL
jgi:hypothetical protein